MVANQSAATVGVHKKKKNTHFKLFQSRPPDPLDTNVLKMARRAIFKTFRGLRWHARLFPKCLNCQNCQNCQKSQNRQKWRISAKKKKKKGFLKKKKKKKKKKKS